MYLANDVIQNSKKKGPEYGKEFGAVLKKAFEHMADKGYDEKTKGSLSRLLKIWNDRGVYDDAQIADFKNALCKSFSDANFVLNSNKMLVFSFYGCATEKKDKK